MSEPANAEHQPPHHVPQRGHRRRRQRGAGPLPRGMEGRMDEGQGWRVLEAVAGARSDDI